MKTRSPHFINPRDIQSTNVEPTFTMPARSELSLRMDDTSVTYVEANADDKEFSGLGTLDEKCVKLYDRSAEDYSMKTGKF